MHSSRYIQRITKHFKGTNVRIAFWTNNTIQTLKLKTYTPKYREPGIYELKCPDCNKVYVDQMGRNLKTRYQEHVSDIKNNGDISKFATHLLNSKHSYGLIDHVMTKIDHANKGSLINIKESLHIYLNETNKSKMKIVAFLTSSVNLFQVKCANKLSHNLIA